MFVCFFGGLLSRLSLRCDANVAEDEDAFGLLAERGFTVEERKILRQRVREVGIQQFDELARRLGGGLDKAYVSNIITGRVT
jgi:hypothetical protein